MKGQVTLFVILGIVILFVVLIALFVVEQSRENEPPLVNPPVSEQSLPVVQYMEQCVADLTKDGLVLLGSNAGYITPNFSPRESLVHEPQVLPYWYYLEDCELAQGCLSSHQPPLCSNANDCPLSEASGSNSIETQLEEYLTTRVTECEANLPGLEITPDGTADVDVILARGDITVKANYPLTVYAGSTRETERIPYVVSSLQVDLVGIYEFSNELTKVQREYNLFDNMILNLISIYSGIDPDLLPPTAGIELFTSGKTVWVLHSVKEMLMFDVLPYLSLVQFINTDGYQPLTSDDYSAYGIYAQGIYDSFEVKTSERYYDVTAEVTYPYSDLDLAIGDGELIEPNGLDTADSIVMKIMGFFLNDYRFNYDLTTPLVVSVQDTAAFDGQGYTFSFALQSVIRNSAPFTINMTRYENRQGFGIDTYSPAQRPLRNITVLTNDKHTDEFLDDVAISYSCGPEFSVGRTSYNGRDAILESRFPFCQFGGSIIARKPGYLSTGVEFDNRDGSDAQTFTLELWPLQEKNIRLYKRTQEDVQSIFTYGPGARSLYRTAVTNLTISDTVVVYLNRVKENSYEEDVPLTAALLFTGGGEVDYNSQVQFWYDSGVINDSMRDELLANELEPLSLIPLSTAEFVPGKYAIDAYMMWQSQSLSENLIIPEKTQTICAGLDAGICIGASQTITYPEQNFSSWVSGGAVLNYTFTEANVYTDEGLTLYVLEMPLPTNWDLLAGYLSIEEYQLGKAHLVRPRVE